MTIPRSVAGPAALDMTGRYAIVTGGSKGIGTGCARALILAGADVTIVSRDLAAGQATASELTAEGPGTCDAIALDVADLRGLAGAIAHLATAHGRLDTLVNNAVTYPGWKSIDDVSHEVLMTTLQTNLGSYVVAAQAALPFLRRARGSIVNISSLAGELGGWHDAVYSASKAGITGFTKALAVEEAANGVRVNAILPGNIVTDARIRGEAAVRRSQDFHDFLERFQWMGRSGTIDEVGNAALFLASELGGYCTGVALPVSGGMEIGYGLKEPYPDFDSQP